MADLPISPQQQTGQSIAQPATDPFYHGNVAPGCGANCKPGEAPGSQVGVLQPIPSPDMSYRGNQIVQPQNQIPLQYDPTAEQLAAAQRANPGRVDWNSPLVRAGPLVVPQDAFYALYTPGDTQRYQEAKKFFIGQGLEIGGGDRAAAGVTGSVTVNAAGEAIPNYGRNEREARGITEYNGPYGRVEIAASGQVLGKSYSLIAGSPPEGFPGQDTTTPRATMPFQPADMITLQKMNGPLPSYAIPTSSLATNNPWDPTLINKAATDRAMQLAAGLVVGREGYNAGYGSFVQSAQAVKSLEAQKQAAQARGDINAVFDIQNREQQAAQNLNEWSRAYHEAGKQMGIPVAANPYEFGGDVAVELLKGTPTRSAETFSPVSGDLLGILPGYKTAAGQQAGLGLQQDAWNAALNRYAGKNPTFQDFSLAAGYLAEKATQGYQGPYGDLYGGQNFKGTVINRPLGEGVGGPRMLISSYEAPTSGNLVGSKMVAGQATVTAPGAELPAPFLSVSAPAPTPQTVLRPSDIDIAIMGLNIPYVSGALVATSDFLFGGRSQATTTKQGTTITPIPSGFEYGESRFVKQTTEKIIPELRYRETGNVPLNYLESGGIGLVMGIREKPLTAMAYTGGGVLLAMGAEAIAGASAYSAAATAGTRAAPYVAGMGTFATKAAPAILTGLYFTDVGVRSTKAGADYSPAAAGRLGGIVSTELLPMIAGGGLYAARGGIFEAVKPTALKIGEVMAGQRGTTVPAAEAPFSGKSAFETFRSSIPSVSQIQMKIVEMRTPATAMGKAAPGEISIVPGRPEPMLNVRELRHRANPALAEAAARREFVMGRQYTAGSARPAIPQGTGKLGYIMTKAQPEEMGIVHLTGLRTGKGGVTDFLATESPYSRIKDITPGKPISASDVAPKYQMVGEKRTTPIYGETTTKTPTGAALASRVELARPEQVSRQGQRLAPREMGMYQYQRGRRLAPESEYEYVTRTLPPGMKAPAPSKELVLNEPIFTMESGKQGLSTQSEVQQAARSRYAKALIPPVVSIIPGTVSRLSGGPANPTALIQNQNMRSVEVSNTRVPAFTPGTGLIVNPYDMPRQAPGFGPGPSSINGPAPGTFQTTVPGPAPIPVTYPRPTPGTPPYMPVFGPFALPGSAGAAGGGGMRKRQAAFVETFGFGLDLSIRGMKSPKAKSFKSPKRGKAPKAARPAKRRR